MRYLLFGVWLALLLAVGLAWMHERYSLASLPSTGQTAIHGFEQHLGAYRFSVWGYDADIFGIPNPDLIGPAVIRNVYFCGGTCTPVVGDDVVICPDCGTASNVPTQNVQVNNGVMIQVNQ